MSKILATANGTTSVTMDYEIELEYLVDVQNKDDKQGLEYEEVQAFIANHGDTLSIEIEVSIDGGEAIFDDIEEITSEKTGRTIDCSDIPTLLMKDIESSAQDCAEENGLESFLW